MDSVVTFTPGANHDSVADLTLALLLTVAHHVAPAHNLTAQGGWKALGEDEVYGHIAQHRPLRTLDNVVLTPHLGGRTLDAQRRQGDMCIDTCLRVLCEEKPAHSVV